MAFVDEETSSNPVLASLALRVPQLNKQLSLEPSYINVLAEAYDEVRNIRKFPKLFPGHARHPSLLKLQKQTQTSVHHQVLKDIVYRDSSFQFANVQPAKATNILSS